MVRYGNTLFWGSKLVQFIRPVKPGQTKVKFGRYFDPNLTYFIKTASKFDQSEKPIFWTGKGVRHAHFHISKILISLNLTFKLFFLSSLSLFLFHTFFLLRKGKDVVGGANEVGQSNYSSTLAHFGLETGRKHHSENELKQRKLRRNMSNTHGTREITNFTPHLSQISKIRLSNDFR